MPYMLPLKSLYQKRWQFICPLLRFVLESSRFWAAPCLFDRFLNGHYTAHFLVAAIHYCFLALISPVWQKVVCTCWKTPTHRSSAWMRWGMHILILFIIVDQNDQLLLTTNIIQSIKESSRVRRCNDGSTMGYANIKGIL